MLQERLNKIKFLVKSTVVFLVLLNFGIFIQNKNIVQYDFFTLAGFILSASCFILAFIIYHFATQKIHFIWGSFNCFVGIWGLGIFLVGISRNASEALTAWKIAHIGVLCLPVLFYHFAHTYCSFKKNRFLKFSYFQCIAVLGFTIFTDYMFKDFYLAFNSIYYYKATTLYTIFFVPWVFIAIIAFRELFNFYRKSSGTLKIRSAYLFFGILLGFLGGLPTVAPAFGIRIYPVYHISIFIYFVITTYAIFKYHLMDLRIAFSRLGIFVFVYAIVLGIPFGLVLWGKDWLIMVFKDEWFWTPMISLLILATAGPFIYIFLQQKTEKRILQEEHRTQELLLQASYGMNTIHNLKRLVDLIVEVVMKIIRVDKAEIYLLNEEGDTYRLIAPTNKRGSGICIKTGGIFIETLKQTKLPIIYEQIRMISQENAESDAMKIAAVMEKISTSVVVPIIIDGSMLGFLALGDRKFKKIFSKDLLNALTVLGNQAALAIENCRYLEAETKRMQQEGLRERMESLDHMASSMAHEIDNPMHGVRTSLSFIKDFIIKDPRFSISEPLSSDLNDAIKRIENCSERVSNMIKAILDYSRLGTGQLMPVKINDAVEGFLELISPQIKTEKVDFNIDVEKNLSLVLGDKIQLEEILMNFTRNSLHAVKLEKYKKISMKIFKKNPEVVRIECSDNGYGIKKEIINDIFLSSMTTKGSSEGTGLGLYRVRKIVDLFRGRVWTESEGKGMGATFIVELPVLQGNMEEILKNNINNDQEN